MTKNEKDALLVEKALKEKWYPLAKGELNYEPQCVLCEEYPSIDCNKRPIKEVYKTTCSKGTPYRAWNMASSFSFSDNEAKKCRMERS